MQIQNVTRKSFATIGTEMVSNIGSTVLRFPPTRHAMVSYVDWRASRDATHRKPRGSYPALPQVSRDRADLGCALLHTADRGLSSGLYHPQVVTKVLRSLLLNAFMRKEHGASVELFRHEHGYGPPVFALLSPGKKCNLHCKGCYASSGLDTEQLDWAVFDRIISEMKNEWGSGFVALSGGEPMAYCSHGKGVLDAAEKNPDMFFLMYTNGTLIDAEVAARMAELGNLTPAISVEGWADRTDARRGQGVFDKVLAAMANLREAGVPFGISLTATRENCEEILADDFLDFFFEEQGALYGWIFQYMPIGRGVSLDLMPTPEQRAWMWQRTWQVIREKRYFLPDFWNMGTASFGCISAGREGGYLYIDWDGKVMPCAFVPHSPVNINEVYQQGGTLSDVLDAPFFKAIRGWQHAYGFDVENPQEGKNWTRPCIIRDHHREFRRILQESEPDPENRSALRAMTDPAYAEGLERYDEELARVMDPIWEREYLGCQGCSKK